MSSIQPIWINAEARSAPQDDREAEPLTADEQIGLIRKALVDGFVLDRFAGSVPIFRRSSQAPESPEPHVDEALAFGEAGIVEEHGEGEALVRDLHAAGYRVARLRGQP